MKKSLSILLLMSVLFTMLASAGHAAGAPPKLFLNGQQLQTDVEPILENGTTYVPVAILSKNLGYDIEWDGRFNKVTVQKDDTMIEMVINEKAMRINGSVVEMDVAPRLVNWRTMVPVRIVGELLGLTFEWKGEEREVHMFSSKPGTETPETETPEAEIGYITSIAMDEQSVIRVSYADEAKPFRAFVLDYPDQPKRLVVDFEQTTYSADIFANHFVGSEARMDVYDNPLLTQYRYSQFNNAPLTARLVVHIGDETGYVVTSAANEVYIALMPADQVPAPEVPAEPEPPATPPVEEDKVYNVVIDAGHGAKDPGAFSKPTNRYEKEFNLSLALKLKAELEKDARIRVLMTRSDDTFLELAERVKFAEDANADIFISIHGNSFTNASVNGSETYYERPESKPLADTLHKYLLKGTGFTDRGVRKAAFRVIKDTTMPAVLLEVGYLSNEKDAKAMFNNEIQSRIAGELAKGVKEYLKLN